MKKILIVPDLALENWPSMDRYASRLVWHMGDIVDDLNIEVAARISKLTVEEDGTGAGKRNSGPRPLPLEPRANLSQIRRYISRYCLYPRRVGRTSADVLHVLDHSYAHVLLTKPQRPAVVTVHDLFPMMILTQPASAIRGRARNWMLRRTLSGLREATVWIVATEWLKREFLEWLGEDAEERVRVIPFGVDDGFFLPPDQEKEPAREVLGIPQDAFVVLHVGSVAPRKNLSAVAATVEGLRDRGIDAWLVQVGGNLSGEQVSDLEKRGIRESVVTTGPVNEGTLRSSYKAADVLLFPSHYEGFGLPVLEAMASGLPVVTSGSGGLAEVAGNAAVVVSGREAEPYIQAVTRIVEDSSWRSGLIERGFEQAGRFRWLEAVKRTVEVYREVG